MPELTTLAAVDLGLAKLVAILLLAAAAEATRASLLFSNLGLPLCTCPLLRLLITSPLRRLLERPQAPDRLRRDISSTFPHCSMVLMRGQNLSGTKCKSFSTTVISSTFVPRV
jgi:hypothetical protein